MTSLVRDLNRNHGVLRKTPATSNHEDTKHRETRQIRHTANILVWFSQEMVVVKCVMFVWGVLEDNKTVLIGYFLCCSLMAHDIF